uniref:mRNA export factor GLE1 n=1 Tax=Crassostrea virginica TaxID=6565 RepID=A0A8B8AH21_CRAVI|nr:uncharacterized protein LOC111101588 isoform X3 [Crassostrea virginica]XP_022289828.1 uncharacterized protein LOC111101588 isoform X4 [Crassostrea virginica]
MMEDEKLSEEGVDEEVQNVHKLSKIPYQDSRSLTNVSEADDEGMLKVVVHDSPKNTSSRATVLTEKEDDQWTSKENHELEGCVLPIAPADDQTSKENIDQELACQQKQTKEENQGLQEDKGQGLSLQIPAVDDNQGRIENNKYHGQSSIYIEEDKGWKRNKDQDDDKENDSLHGHLEKGNGELDKDCSSTQVFGTNEQKSYSLQKSSIEDTRRHLEVKFDAFSLRKLFGEDDQTTEEEIQKGVSFFKEEYQNTPKKNFFMGRKITAFPTKTHKSNISPIGSASFRDLKRSPQVGSQHLMKKYVCNVCKKWSLYWNVCRDCNIFLCDGCIKRNHSPVLHHEVTRYMGFSEFGCPDHIEICHYFCLDCTRPCCEACKITKCRHHYLTKDLRKREDKYVGDNSMQMRDREKPTSLIKKNMAFNWPRTSSGGSSDHCRYCFTTHERYNLCEDCLDFFCDSCLVNYHPPGHSVCKRIPFSVFACREHKAVYRYFCNHCKELRCEDCILMEGQCSGHADRLEQSVKHMAHEQTKFEETVDNSSQTIDTLLIELDQIEDQFTMRAMLSRDTLRQEMTSLQNLITEKETQLFGDFEEEYQCCINRIRECKMRCGNLMEENGEIVSKSLQILRKNNLHAFFFSAQKMWSRLDKHKKALDSLSCPDDVLHSQILVPFSLTEEKRKLEQSLQIQNFDCPSLECHRHTVYYKDYSKPLRVDEMVTISNSTSSTFSLSVEIKSSVKDTLWKSDDCACQQYIANVFGRVILKPNRRYLLKFTLQSKEDRIVPETVKSCHVLLITGIGFSERKINCDARFGAYMEYIKLQQKLGKTEAVINVISSSQHLKSLKFDLMKAASIPFNAFSAVSGAHMRNNLERLLVLLSGQQVEINNKRVSVSKHPTALNFCKYLIAKMIVKNGEEQVSSNFESAFPLAAVAVGLLVEHSDIKDLLLGHFHSLCPYTVPYQTPRLDQQSTEDYYKSLGYKQDSDGNLETQEKFLRRMSGIMRLFASLMVSLPPQRLSAHPFGIENAWLWLSRVVNIRTHPDITATMVIDLLEVTGHALHREYRKQFLKMLLVLFHEYVPKLKLAASSGGGEAVYRLEALIKTGIEHQGHIPPPEGLLSQNVWFS